MIYAFKMFTLCKSLYRNLYSGVRKCYDYYRYTYFLRKLLMIRSAKDIPFSWQVINTEY